LNHLSSEEGHSLLHSANSGTCIITLTYGNFGDQCFTANGWLWNSLPAGLRQTDIGYKQFKRLLKTYLFGHWDRGALLLTICLNCASPNFLTYLFTLCLIIYESNESNRNTDTSTGAYTIHGIIFINNDK